jgi:tRNA threonylcarbamoyladenosine biosynthesis protein TsaB
VREAELLLTRDSLPQAIADSGLPLVVCELRVFDALADLSPALVTAPGAVDALRVGAWRFRSGCFDDAATLDANYLRRSETEMLARIAEHAARRAAQTTVPSGS